MTRHFSGTSDHMDSSSPPFTGKPGAIGIWRYAAAQPGQTDIYAQVSDGTNNNRFCLGGDITAASGKVAGVVNSTWQALTTNVPSNSAWHFHLAAFATGNSVYVYNDTGNKGSTASVGNPTGINKVQVGGRGNADLAYATYWNRVPNDVEEAYLGSGGNPRYLSGLLNFYYVTASSGTETDRFGSTNLTVTGTSAAISSAPPPVGTYWTAAAQTDQSATQASTFPAIDLTTKFEQLNGVDYTCTILQVGAAGTALAANGAGTASNLLTVTGTAPTAGQYVSIAGGAKTLVLYVSGQTLLLATARTWSNGDSVTPYPVSAPTGLTTNGYTMTGNVTGGTVGAGAVGTYANLLYRATNNTNGQIADSALFGMTVAASGAAPSFSTGPTLTSATTDGYVFGATSNQTATWYAVAMLRGSTAPTAAQVKSGSPTGFVSRFSQALTASVAGTLTFTALTNPVYDLYHVVDNGSGTSAVAAFTGAQKAPPAGKQYVPITIQGITAITQANPASVTSTAHGRTTGDWVELYGVVGMTQINGIFTTCTVTDANHLTLDGIDSTGFTAYGSGGVLSWGQSIYANSSVLAATGDIGIIDQVTAPSGLPVTVGPGGYVSIGAGTATIRQSFAADFYDVSGQVIVGVATDYFQSQSPSAPVTPDVPIGIFVPANQAIASIDLRTLATDPQGDTLTATLTPLPAGLSVSGGILSGTTGAASVTLGTATWTNTSGDQATAPINVVVGNVTPPNLAGLSQGAIQSLLSNYYLTPVFGQQDNTAAAGTAIAQSPPFGTTVSPNTTINVTLSTGVPPLTFAVVPDVSSAPTDQATATNLLTTAGFVVNVPQSWVGTIKVYQSPQAGTQLSLGSVVGLFLGAGSPARRQPKRKAARPPAYKLRAPLKARK